MGADVTVSDNAEVSRYEARLGGDVAGFAAYLLQDDAIVFTHTEVGPEGLGIGSALARHTLDDARERDLRVVPRCPFLKRYIDKHVDNADLV